MCKCVYYLFVKRQNNAGVFKPKTIKMPKSALIRVTLSLILSSDTGQTICFKLFMIKFNTEHKYTD